VAVGARHDLRALHQANQDLLRLRGVEARRATLEERARLARDVHDGLVQDLWLARLKQDRLSRLPRLRAEVRLLAKEVDQAIEAALSEARRALQLVLPSAAGGSSFRQNLSQAVTEFSDRFGLPIELTVEGHVDGLPQPVQSELLGIVREALNNARKHADATVVRLKVAGDRRGLRISISDDGRGFDLEGIPGGVGLQSMRERARLIGADLSIASRPDEGTVVMVAVALPPPEASRRERDG
jgi:signal transduction histidine kinase